MSVVCLVLSDGSRLREGLGSLGPPALAIRDP